MFCGVALYGVWLLNDRAVLRNVEGYIASEVQFPNTCEEFRKSTSDYIFICYVDVLILSMTALIPVWFTIDI